MSSSNICTRHHFAFAHDVLVFVAASSLFAQVVNGRLNGGPGDWSECTEFEWAVFNAGFQP
jgi:hypothetical protein